MFWSYVMAKVLVTGGAGQIAYSLLFRIASGELFGNEPITLHILEVKEGMQALLGVKMELEDAAFPLLEKIVIGSDPLQVFEGVTHAFLVGAKPRGPGMERGELLSENGKIFIDQGRALDEVADKQVKVLVVGNPCNTNCLIAIDHAKRISKKNFHAMTRLDQNRARFQLANRAHVPLKEVSHVTIWGNHSSTQVPDFVNARIQGKKVQDVIQDKTWLEKTFIETVQKRGAEIIAARGKSSAASAASSAIDAMRSIITPTKQGEWYSSAIFSEGNPYGIDPGLVFSFPCRTLPSLEVEIVRGLEITPFLKEKLLKTEQELKEEREVVCQMSCLKSRKTT